MEDGQCLLPAQQSSLLLPLRSNSIAIPLSEYKYQGYSAIPPKHSLPSPLHTPPSSPTPTLPFHTAPPENAFPNCINSRPDFDSPLHDCPAEPFTDYPYTTCLTCHNNHSQSALAYPQTPIPKSMTQEQKACMCSLVSDFSWLTSCESPTLCPDELIGLFELALLEAPASVSCTALLTQDSSVSLMQDCSASLTIKQHAGSMALTVLITVILL